MENTNGIGRFPGQTVLGARRRVNARPKTITFDVDTVNDGVVAIVGFCRGRSDGYGPCPVNVTMEVEAAFDVWRDRVYVPATDAERRAWDEYVAACAEKGEDPGECPISDEGLIFHSNRSATLTLHRDLLLAVLPGLDRETASVLAGDEGDWEGMLTDLGWYTPAPAPDSEAARPEGEGEESPSIGATSSPESVPSTASDQPIS